MKAVDTLTDDGAKAVWAAHYQDCLRCRNYREGKSATLAHICPTGVPLIKRVLEIAAKPALENRKKAERQLIRQHAPKLDNGMPARTTKKKLASVMRYKEADE